MEALPNNELLLVMMSISAFLVVYWVIFGQWKYNKMMKHPENIKAVIFDLDGVLIDSEKAWFDIFNKARTKLNLKKVSKKEFMKKIWGISFEKASKKYFKNISREKLQKIYFSGPDSFNKSTKLIPEVKETLRRLREMNIKLGVATNSPRKAALNVLSYHKIKNYFKVIVGSDDVEHGKPEPDLILHACKRLGIKPKEALYVGDTLNDKHASKFAGTTFVGYKINGDIKIYHFQDLLMLV